MMITVPVPAYQGVLLDWAAGEDGAPSYRLLLAHRDRDLDVVLAETPDESAAADEWAAWAAWLGLPRLAVDGSGRGRHGGRRAPRRRAGSAPRRVVGQPAPSAFPRPPQDRRRRARCGRFRRGA